MYRNYVLNLWFIIAIMKKVLKYFSILLFIFFIGKQSWGQYLYFDGVYTGKKMVLNNPLSSDLFGTCIHRITINGEIYPFNISDNYVEVNLAKIGLKEGDIFSVIIDHEATCKPIIYNKDAFYSSEKFEYENLSSTAKSLRWSTKNNLFLSPFIIELKFRNVWVKIAEIESLGLGDQGYELEIPFVLSGESLFRVHKANIKNSYGYFPSIISPNQNIEIESKTVEKRIYFLQNEKLYPTYYQLYDQNDLLVKKGYGKTADVTNLKSGFYTLYYDNKKTIITKK